MIADPTTAEASEKLYTLEDTERSGYYYDVWEVDKAAYDAADVGSEYHGGVVVDGILDKGRNVLLLIVCHDEETNDGHGYEHPEGKPFFLKKGLN